MTDVLVVLVVLLVVGAVLALRARRAVDAGAAEPVVSSPETTRAERDAATLGVETGGAHRNGHGDLHTAHEQERS